MTELEMALAWADEWDHGLLIRTLAVAVKDLQRDLSEMRKTEAATRRDCTAAVNWAEQLEAELAVLRKGKP